MLEQLAVASKALRPDSAIRPFRFCIHTKFWPLHQLANTKKPKQPQLSNCYMLTLLFPLCEIFLHFSHFSSIISPKSMWRSTHAWQNICHLLRLRIQRRLNHLKFKSSRACQGAAVVWLRGSVGDLAPLTVTLDDINSESPTGERLCTAGPGLSD